ncbi:DUF3558 domain-containing protein [Streptomyces sp. BI20]|uniref:DUF3558 domain-containing protein n=1 Tax=Streptomyces sp. BI20 TaxID=3403460 RepID=UPI003C7482F6
MHRSASRLTRVLACAAVPVILTVAGCSSDSGKSSDTGKKEKSASSDAAGSSSAPSAAPEEKAKYAKLPEPCKLFSAKSIGDLVPSAKEKGGTPAKSNDLAARASCSWNGLESDGLKGSDYRWLSASLVRYDSHDGLGGANKRAEEQFAKQVATAKGTAGAKSVKESPEAGIGDKATTITYTVTKDDAPSFNTTVVVRVENIVLSLDYNGAAFEGATEPDHDKLLANAIGAAKEAVGVIDGKGGGGTKSDAPKPSGSASAKPSGSASPSATPSGSASSDSE